MSRQSNIVQKRPVYFGCEGESEGAYGQLLNDFLRAADLPVYLNVDVLAPAGDPLARVERALGRIARQEHRRTKFWLKTILMDSDQAALVPERSENAERLAARYNIAIVWQNPCHEALLLRHLPGCANRNPLSSRDAEQALKREWTEYSKPMARAQLSRRIDIDAIRRIANVDGELHTLLSALGLLQ